VSRADQPQAIVLGPQFPYPPDSGAVKRTLRILEAVERAGAEVHYFTTDPGGTEAARAMTDRGWSIHVIPDELNGLRTRLDVHLRLQAGRQSRRLAETVRRFVGPRSAFVQAEQIFMEGYLKGLTGVRSILSAHNVDSDAERLHTRELSPASPARALSSYRTFRYARAEHRGCRADAVLCVSEADGDHFRRYARNVIVAPNGVDEEFFQRGEAESPEDYVLFFGLMRYEPNAEGLLRFLREGWPVLRGRNADVRLVVAGGGSRERLSSVAPDSRVSVLGLADDIAPLVTRAKVVIVPVWRGGGTRLKVLEALATGRPVVGTSLGVSGIGFEHGVHGLVADEPAELALAVAELCADPVKARDLGAAGRDLAEHYRWERALAPAEALYRAYVEETARRLHALRGI